MGENKMKKKAELTTAQLVGLIVLIVSFVVVLILFFRLNLGEQTNKEICHNSVVLKSKTEGFVGSLDCRTDYTCVSGGSDCAGLSSSSNVKVDASDKEAIMKVLADKMSDCWWQFGEGKVTDYAGGVGDIAPTKVYCAACLIVQFDKKVQEKNLKITYSELYNYLRTTQKDSSQSYLKYLYGVNDLNSLEIQEQFKIVDINQDFISTRDKYSILTGIDSNANNNNIDEGPLDNELLKVYIIPTIETPATSCTDFITKA